MDNVTKRAYRVSVICTVWNENDGEEYQVVGQEVLMNDSAGHPLPKPITVDKRERVGIRTTSCDSATVFEQTVSDLDIKAVVAAVNGMEVQSK